MFRKAISAVGQVFQRRSNAMFASKCSSSRSYNRILRGAVPVGSAVAMTSCLNEHLMNSSESNCTECHYNVKSVNSSIGSVTDHYRVNFLQNLGTGNYGSVCRAVDKLTGEEVAVKRVLRSRSNECAIRDETSILGSVNHDNIIQLKGLFNDKKSWYIVMELAQGEELFNRIVTRGLLDQQQTSRIMHQLISAVAHLHGKGIVHGDIKPENCILDESDCQSLCLKLADFGSAFCMKSGPAPRKDYTAAYSPPEVITGESFSSSAGDVWALGVVMYILLTGLHPFDPTGASSEKELAHRILHTEPDFDCVSDPSARSLIKQALSRNPKNRPTAQNMLQHSWVKSSHIRTSQ